MPLSVADLVQGALEANGCRVHREYAVIARYQLKPIMAVTTDEIELPSRARRPSNVPDGMRVVRRPFVVHLSEVFKNDLLAKLMLGGDDGTVKNFPFTYFQDDDEAVFVWQRLQLQMFGQFAPGTYTAMSKVSATPPCVLSFDFRDRGIEQLLALLPSTSRAELEKHLSSGTPAFRVTPGSVVVGVRARRAAPEPADTIPFNAIEFTPASENQSIVIEF